MRSMDSFGSPAFERAHVVVRRLIAERHDRPSLVSDIACRIGAEIIEGVRRQADDLNSVELARAYDTSRTPVREALLLLEKEGLVEIQARRRPRVATFALDDIRDIYRARSALLELAARSIASTITAEQLDVLRQHLANMASALDEPSAYMWANVDFHTAQTEICGNRYVKRVVDSLLLRTLPLRRLSLSQNGRLHRSYDDHSRLVQSYAEGDADLAAAIVRNNHMNALVILEKLLAEPQDRRHGRKSAARQIPVRITD